MKVDEKGFDLLRTEALRGVWGTSAEPGTKPVEAITPVTRMDRVQISDAGRMLAAQGAATEADAAREPLGADQVDEIRRRVLTGAYDSLAVIDQVARRMLQRGDV